MYLFIYVCIHGNAIIICLSTVTVGSYELCVHTWRPAGRRILDKMRRFFVGGSPEIDDVSYIATPKDFQVSA